MGQIENAKFGEVYEWATDGMKIMCVEQRGETWTTVILTTDGSGDYDVGDVGDYLYVYASDGDDSGGWTKVDD